jgi:hypothetical protein
MQMTFSTLTAISQHLCFCSFVPDYAPLDWSIAPTPADFFTLDVPLIS